VYSDITHNRDRDLSPNIISEITIIQICFRRYALRLWVDVRCDRELAGTRWGFQHDRGKKVWWEACVLM